MLPSIAKALFTITALTWLETHPSLWLSARLKCLWRSPAWWGTVSPVYCLEEYPAAKHKTISDMYKSWTWNMKAFSCFQVRLTFKFFSLWQQIHRTSLICLSQGMVRSFERAKDTYHTWGPKHKNSQWDKITNNSVWNVGCNNISYSL